MQTGPQHPFEFEGCDQIAVGGGCHGAPMVHILKRAANPLNRWWNFILRYQNRTRPIKYHQRPAPGPSAHSRRGCAAPLSSSSSAALTASPPPKPVSEPSAPMTRWQGITMGMGLLPLARPTARDPLGLPSSWARAPY